MQMQTSAGRPQARLSVLTVGLLILLLAVWVSVKLRASDVELVSHEGFVRLSNAKYFVQCGVEDVANDRPSVEVSESQARKLIRLAAPASIAVPKLGEWSSKYKVIYQSGTDPIYIVFLADSKQNLFGAVDYIYFSVSSSDELKSLLESICIRGVKSSDE